MTTPNPSPSNGSAHPVTESDIVPVCENCKKAEALLNGRRLDDILAAEARVRELVRLGHEDSLSRQRLEARVRVAADAINWVLKDAYYKAPEQIGQAGEAWISRLKDAAAALKASDEKGEKK